MAVRKVAQASKSNQQQLGTLIAAVLAHPDTPVNLYDAIATAIADLQKREIVDTPEFIQTLLDLNKKYVKPEEEHGGVVVLTQLGADILGAIKLVQKVTGLNSTEARDLVKSIPKPLKDDVDPEEAEAVKKQFAEIGCTVRFDRPQGGAA